MSRDAPACPIADGPAVRRYVGDARPPAPAPAVDARWSCTSLAALAALAAPRLLGDLVEAVENGTTVGHVDRIVVLLAGFLVLQTVLTRYARYARQVLGEQVLAELREDFVGNTLALPVGVVEAAGSGDLLTRTSRDVDQLGWSVRWALPEWTIARRHRGAHLRRRAQRRLVGARCPCLLGVPPLVIGLRWYLARAKDGYLARDARRTPRSTRRSPRPSRAPAPSRRSASARSASRAIDDDSRESFARRALHAATCAPCSSRAWSSPTCCPTVGDAAVRRLALHPRPGLARRGHRRDALRPDAHRPGRPDRVDPRRAPARRRVAGPAARRRAGARRPRRSPAREPRRREARRRATSGSPTSRAATCCTASTSTSASASGSRWSVRPAPASRRSAGCSPASTRRAPAR